MKDWLANPVAWVALLSLLSMVVGGAFAFGTWKGRVDSDRASFKEFTKEVRDDIKEILGRLPSPRVADTSPLHLTDCGKSISKRLGAPELAENLVQRLRAQVEGRTPYEIQEKCFDYARREYEPPEEVEVRVKNCAYDFGIKRGQVLDVLAVELRDKLLANP